MMVKLTSATRDNGNAVLTLEVTYFAGIIIPAQVRVPMATLNAATTQGAKRAVLLTAFRAQFQPPQPPQLGVAELGVNVGDSFDLG